MPVHARTCELCGQENVAHRMSDGQAHNLHVRSDRHRAAELKLAQIVMRIRLAALEEAAKIADNQDDGKDAAAMIRHHISRLRIGVTR